MKDTRAPGGIFKRFRVVEIDIRIATGLEGEPEDCATVIGDYPFKWFAKLVASRRKGGRFPRQVHNQKGECIAYYD